MPFIYYGQGVASLYTDFVERLMSHLALKGTEITHQELEESRARMHVQHTGEKGSLSMGVEGKNIRVTYTVERERKEVAKGIRGGVLGAVTGAGLGSILGGVLRGEQNVGDALTGAVGGAAAGGVHGAYDGYEESREDRTHFAAVLAETVKEVEDELQSILQGQEEAREALRERGRQRREAEEEKENEMRELLEEIYGDLLTAQEEVDLAESEGLNASKPKARIVRAEKLYREAEAALEKGDYAVVKAKLKAARSMVDGALAALGGDEE